LFSINSAKTILAASHFLSLLFISSNNNNISINNSNMFYYNCRHTARVNTCSRTQRTS